MWPARRETVVGAIHKRKRGPKGRGSPWQQNARKVCKTRFSITFARQKTPLTIFLVNGVKLQGVVTWFDNFCVLLRRDGHSQLVYKHAISTIMPGQPIQLDRVRRRGRCRETNCARPIRKS